MSSPPNGAHSPEPGGFWQRRVVNPVMQQLTQGITPEKIALTFAVGSAFAFFPILGTTTILCLIVGILLRLNQPLIQLVNAFCTLPHLLVIYPLFRLGGFIFGARLRHANASEFIFHAPHAHFNILMILGVFSKSHRPFWHRVEVDALHAIVAWLIVAPIWAAILYWVSLPFLKEVVRSRAEKAIETADIKAPEHPVP